MEKEGLSLVKCQDLAKPKELDLWGLKNIYHLQKALAAKCMDRLWNQILVQKYIETNIVDRLQTLPNNPTSLYHMEGND